MQQMMTEERVQQIEKGFHMMSKLDKLKQDKSFTPATDKMEDELQRMNQLSYQSLQKKKRD